MGDPCLLLHCYVTILRRTIADKNVQVFHSSVNLLQAVCQNLLEGKHFERNPSRAHQELDPLMPLLVDRLGDANGRLSSIARDALLDFARCPSVGAQFTAKCLLSPPSHKKKV